MQWPFGRGFKNSHKICSMISAQVKATDCIMTLKIIFLIINANWSLSFCNLIRKWNIILHLFFPFNIIWFSFCQIINFHINQSFFYFILIMQIPTCKGNAIPQSFFFFFRNYTKIVFFYLKNYVIQLEIFPLFLCGVETIEIINIECKKH